MTKEEIFSFCCKHSAAVVATCENTTPHLRTIWTVMTGEYGVLFHTGKRKAFYQQLLQNPNVEMCFTNPDKSVQIRIAGTAKEIDDQKLKESLVKKRPFLKDFADMIGNIDFFSPFILEQCNALVWTFATDASPKEFVEFGNNTQDYSFTI